MTNKLYEKHLTKDFYKAQSAYFDACNVEFLAWQSYNTQLEKASSCYGEDGEFILAIITEELKLEIDKTQQWYKQAKLSTQEAKKKYQECGAIV
jgi:hypothetical protein